MEYRKIKVGLGEKGKRSCRSDDKKYNEIKILTSAM